MRKEVNVLLFLLVIFLSAFSVNSQDTDGEEITIDCKDIDCTSLISKEECNKCATSCSWKEVDSVSSCVKLDLKDEAKKGLTKVTGRADDFIEKSITIPSPYDKFARVLIGTRKTMPLNELVIHLCLYLILFLFFTQIFSVFSPFSQGSAIAIGFALIIIFATTGLITYLTTIILEISVYFELIEAYVGTIGFTVFSIIALILIFVIIKKLVLNLLKKIKENEKIAKHKYLGKLHRIVFRNQIENDKALDKIWAQ